MNPDKNQVIVQYLLGSLPAAEAERLDELSVSDEEFANALSVAENDLVDSYVQGELTGETLERFNSHYLASPLRSDKVRFAESFQRWAEKDAGRVQRGSVGVEAQKPSSWSFLTAPRLALQWSFATAALVLLVTVGWLMFENIRLRQQVAQIQVRGDGTRQEELQKELEAQRAASAANEQELARVRQEQERLQQELKKAQEQQRTDVQGEQRAAREQPPSSSRPTSIASFILSPQLRGAGGITTISIPAKTDQIELKLNLEPDDHPAYQVMLIDPSSNQILWRSNRLKARGADDGKSLTIRLSASLLKPQAYILRVNGVSAGGASETISDYAFKVGK